MPPDCDVGVAGHMPAIWLGTSLTRVILAPKYAVTCCAAKGRDMPSNRLRSLRL